MKITHRISVMACLLTCLLCSCSHDVIYDADYYKQKYVQTFEDIFGTVDSTQMWTTETSYVANVKVNLGTQETYNALVYLNNPLFNESDAQLLGSGSVSDGSSTTIKFNGPTVQTHYYVAISDSKNRNIAQLDSIKDGVLDANFGGTTSAAKAMTRGIASSSYERTQKQELGSLTNSEMAKYTSLTDADILELFNVQKSRILNDKMYFWSQEKGSYTQYAADGDGYHYKIDKGVTVSEAFSMQNYLTTKDVNVLYVEGTLNMTSLNTFTNVTIVIASTGVVNIASDVTMSQGNSRIVIEAGGVLNSTSNATFLVDNGGGDNYNAGTINMPSGCLNINGGYLYNCGTINVNKLHNSTTNGIIVNFGKITANENDYKSGSYNAKYINECYMKFGNVALGNMIMTDNSRLDVSGLLYMNGTNSFGDKSEINTKDLKLEHAIFNGPEGTEYAIIKTTNMFISEKGDGTFNNNVYVDWDKTKCYDYGNKNKQYNMEYKRNNNSSQGYYFASNIKNWSSETGSALTIPAGDCTGSGYNDQSTGKELPYTGAVSTLAYEDLGATDDFDFNDIVLYVYGIGTQNSNTQSVTFSKIHVDMVAAGGVLSSKVFFGNTSGTPILSHTDGVMKNTYSYGGILDSLTFNVPSGTTYTDDSFVNNIILEVDDNSDNTNSAINNISKTTDAGKAPQVLHVSGKWKWPKERQPIDGVYNTEGHKFLEWVQNHTWSPDWYLYPSGTVISAE